MSDEYNSSEFSASILYLDQTKGNFVIIGHFEGDSKDFFDAQDLEWVAFVDITGFSSDINYPEWVIQLIDASINHKEKLNKRAFLDYYTAIESLAKKITGAKKPLFEIRQHPDYIQFSSVFKDFDELKMIRNKLVHEGARDVEDEFTQKIALVAFAFIQRLLTLD